MAYDYARNLEMNRTYRKRFPERYLWFNARKRAKAFNLEFNIKQEDIKIPEVCPVLGIPIEIKVGNGHKFGRYNSPSIDRFDNSKGYTKDNIRVISWRANNLKSNGTLEEFRRLVRWMENGESKRLP